MISMLVLSILGLGCGTGEPAIEGEFVESELLVQFADKLSSSARKQVLDEYGFTELTHMNRIGVSHLDTQGEGVAVALRRMRKDDFSRRLMRENTLTVDDLIRDGVDPIDARKTNAQARQRDAQALTFEKAAREVHEDLKPGWQNPKHAAQWITTLEAYVFPHIGNRKVESLKARDFADALRTIWLKKPETASRVKQRCSAVMDWCAAQELIGANRSWQELTLDGRS